MQLHINRVQLNITFVCTGKPKIHVTDFIVIFTLLWCLELTPQYLQDMPVLGSFRVDSKSKERFHISYLYTGIHNMSFRQNLSLFLQSAREIACDIVFCRVTFISVSIEICII